MARLVFKAVTGRKCLQCGQPLETDYGRTRGRCANCTQKLNLARLQGEGSRGGHVIGHKPSGKPKYGIPRTRPSEQQLRDEATERSVGTSEQWDRVRAARGAKGIHGARAEAAYRNARMFGTDPSWYGF